MRERYWHFHNHDGLDREEAKEACRRIDIALGKAPVKAYEGPPETEGFGITAITVCHLFEGETYASTGYSICSNRDQFSKKTGRNIARARAYQALEVTL